PDVGPAQRGVGGVVAGIDDAKAELRLRERLRQGLVGAGGAAEYRDRWRHRDIAEPPIVQRPAVELPGRVAGLERAVDRACENGGVAVESVIDHEPVEELQADK